MKNFEMTEQELYELMSASKPVAMIALQCGQPSSPQENANEAWRKLGEKYGFNHMTVQPRGSSKRCFSAELVDKGIYHE